MKIRVNLPGGGYDITVERGAIMRADKIFDLSRRALIVTDSGVPAPYVEKIAARCARGHIVTVSEGEGSKSMETYSELLEKMLSLCFDRGDCVVAVGGGVVGDLAGFVAATFMRGVDFYNVPTTLLSQVDSSVGGKTGINLGKIKNVVGAFYQPRGVLIDPDVLYTLSERQFSSGLSEAIKMAATCDEKLFELIEKGNVKENTEEIIVGALNIKRRVVEADEREGGLRRVLNFGHTIGHGIEAVEGGRLYHGECVSLGMIPMCSESVRKRLENVLGSNGLPTEYTGDIGAVARAMEHDKKSDGGNINAITVDKIGSYSIKKETVAELATRARKVWGTV